MSSGLGARGKSVDPAVDSEAPVEATFSEKGFYLSELRGRTLAIAGRGSDLRAPGVLEPVLRELEANRTSVVVIGDDSDPLEGLAAGSVLAVGEVGDRGSLRGRVWRALGPKRRAAVVTASEDGFAAGCAEVVQSLGIRKLVWIDRAGGLRGDRGRRDSFIDVPELGARIALETGERRDLLIEVRQLLEAGVEAVNLCTLEGVADELFTYDGSGTLFTREGYVRVDRLGLDDFDAAADLIERGVSEGYLARRQPEEVERVLAGGFGAFVGGNHLAGIGTLLAYPEARAAEIGSLYTLTRFVGEGVGGHLVRHALDRAREVGCGFVFACTTSERVAAFFQRNGFRSVTEAEIPEAKWSGYDPERRPAVQCLRHDLG